MKKRIVKMREPTPSKSDKLPVPDLRLDRNWGGIHASSMAFHSSCISLKDSLNDGDLNKAILEFLLTEALGRKNAKSWPRIEERLLEAGIALPEKAKEAFQTGLLGKTRQGEEFIGSTNKGFFIIVEHGDAEATRRFYQNRIYTEIDRLRRLDALIEQQFPLD